MLIGVRTADGRIEPVRDRALFSTTVDRQRTALFELFYRRSFRLRWHKLQDVALEHLPPAHAGEPDLHVRILPSRGRLMLEVTDSFTGRSQTLPLTARNARARVVAGACLIGLLASAAGLALVRPILRPVPARSPAAAAEAPSRADDGALESAAVGESQAASAAATPGASIETRAPAPPPAPEPSAVAPPDTEYRVVWGDTLWQIAERFYGDRALYHALASDNDLVDADLIIAGETLRIPQRLAREAP